MLRPPDIYILCGLVAVGDEPWTFRELAERLCIPHALVQRALPRAEELELYSSGERRVDRLSLEEILVHGIRFVAPAKLGKLVSGIPAAWGADPVLALTPELPEPRPVWQTSGGRFRGLSLTPLHPAAVRAAREFPELARVLAIVDSLRAGDVRVRAVAASLLVDLMN